MVRLLRSGKCYGSYDVLWKCSVFFDIFWYILMILTRHLAHLGSSWLSICLYTATNTEQLTSWQPDHPIIVRLRLILISWLISLVQLSSAWFSFVDCVIICNKLLFLIADVAAAVRKEAFAAQEAIHQLLRERQQLWLSDEELEIYRLSTRLVSTHLDVQVCWAVGMFHFYAIWWCICFVFFATSKRPRLLVLSCIDFLLNCFVFQSKNISNEAAFWFQHQDGLPRSWAVAWLHKFESVAGGLHVIGQYQGISLGRAVYFWIFFAAGFGFFWGFLVLCFPAFLLFCFSVFLLLCFSAFCFSCFSACLLLFFSASLLSLLLCFCASVPFYFYYSTFSFLQSCVLAVLLPAPLLLCFLSLHVFTASLFFSFPALYSLLFVS